MEGDGQQPSLNGPALARHGAEAVRDEIARVVAMPPEELRRSFDLAPKSGDAQHAQAGIHTGLKIYFCDPHRPWQPGTSENANGLLRQFFPRRPPVAASSRRSRCGHSRAQHSTSQDSRLTYAAETLIEFFTPWRNATGKSACALEPEQFPSVRFTERLDEIGALASTAPVADLFDKAMSESIYGALQGGVCLRPDADGWDGADQPELEAVSSVHWYNHKRLHGHCHDVPTALSSKQRSKLPNSPPREA